MRDTSDRQLVERLREGDATAVPELQTTYGARIYQLAFRYMKNREDAEEVMQDVLLRVFRKIDAFRGDAALSSCRESRAFPLSDNSTCDSFPALEEVHVKLDSVARGTLPRGPS